MKFKHGMRVLDVSMRGERFGTGTILDASKGRYKNRIQSGWGIRYDHIKTYANDDDCHTIFVKDGELGKGLIPLSKLHKVLE